MKPKGTDMELIEVRKIWNQAPHNAFTDLTYFRGHWFCVFREGQGHVSPDGALRVIVSSDGQSWQSAALIKSDDSDLRDAKITATPGNQLMLCGAQKWHAPGEHTHQSLAWFSDDGQTWSDGIPIAEPDFWLWRVTWHQDKAYGIGYACNTQSEEERIARLYVSDNGKQFETRVANLFDEGYPNESSIVFDGDTAYCLLRRDHGGRTGQLGVSQPPYTDWTWKDLGVRTGGPHMLRLPDGRLLAAVRLYEGSQRTSLCWVDPRSATLTEALTLPSGGDTSYAGLVFQDGVVWVSYYSSHEDKTSIYLAKVNVALPAIKGTPETQHAVAVRSATFDDVVHLGSRRELFVDRLLVDKMYDVDFRLHPPQRAPRPASPLVGGYATVIKDGDRYRGYYRDVVPDYDGDRGDGHPGEITCYAESADGQEWTYPDLDVTDVKSARGRDVILAGQPPFSHNFSPFLDQRPGVPAEERFKALAGKKTSGLCAFCSPDGIHWRKMQEDPVITLDHFGFDSQNVAFWSITENCYVCYFRTFKSRHGRLRTIYRTTSRDFIHWGEEAAVDPNLPGEQLYTSQTHPYFRAPHIYVALPTRYVAGRVGAEETHAMLGSTDILFMASRAGTTTYDRLFTEAFIRPGLDPERWESRANYVAQNVVPTGPNEMSIYHARSGHRYALRTDGFISVHAGAGQGELITRPLTFYGQELVVNYSTAAAGGLRVEIQDQNGVPMPGFALHECHLRVGDEIDGIITWKGNPNLCSLAGKPVRLRLAMAECDVYSFRFRAAP